MVFKQVNMSVFTAETLEDLGVSSVNPNYVAVFYKHFLTHSLCLLFLLLNRFPWEFTDVQVFLLVLFFIQLFKAFGLPTPRWKILL